MKRMNLKRLWCVLVIIAFSMPVFAAPVVPGQIDSFDNIAGTGWVEAGGQAGWGSYMVQETSVKNEGTGSMKIDFTQYTGSIPKRDEPFRNFGTPLDCSNYKDLAITLWVWVKDPCDTRVDGFDSRLTTIVLTDSTFSEYTPGLTPYPYYEGNMGFFKVPPFKTAGWNKVIAPLRNFLWRDAPSDAESSLVDPNADVVWSAITNIALFTFTPSAGDHDAIYIDDMRWELAPNQPARPYQLASFDNIWDELWQETHGCMYYVLQTPGGDPNFREGTGSMMIDYEDINDVEGYMSNQEPKTALIPALDFTDGNDWAISVWVWSDLPNPYGTAFDDSYLWEIILYDAGGNTGHWRVPRQDFDAGTGWTKVTARIDEFIWEKPPGPGSFADIPASQANLEAIVAISLWTMDYPHFGNNIYLDDMRIEPAVEALSEATVYNADYGTITVDGDASDWAGLVNSDIIDFDLADPNIKGQPTGNMHVKYRLAWDQNYLYILVEEQPGDDLAWEASSRINLGSGSTNTAGTFYDSLALSFDFTNSKLPSVDVHMALYLIVGLSSTERTDLMISFGNPRGPDTRWVPYNDLIANGSVATGGTLGNRVIEAKLKWTDLESAISSWFKPAGGIEAAVQAGYIFGCDPHLQDLDNKSRFSPDADHGSAWFSGRDNPIQWPQGNYRWPSGRDTFSTDIRLWGIQVNQAPSVNAGLDQMVIWPLEDTATLDSTVSDDGLPDPPASLTYLWEKVSGPGTVTFDPNEFVEDPNATFSTNGTYVLRLTADDSLLSDSDEVTIQVTIQVNQAPSVNAGLDQMVIWPLDTATLDSTVSDDGLPDPPASLTYLWEKVSGPGTVTFDPNEFVEDPNATFSTNGTYVLRLTADDSLLSASDEVTILLNQAPTVDAGSDQTINLPADTVSLDSTVSDDGLPDPPASLTYLWEKVSGPGTVTFDPDEFVEDPNATFSTNGTYVLRLTADDSLLSDSDEVTIQVNQAPSVDAGVDQMVIWPLEDTATLDSTVSDDGLPDPPASLTYLWEKVSGPGTVTFEPDEFVEDPNATFSTNGTYVLRLTADDSLLSDSDEVTIQVTIQVNQAPSVNAGLDQMVIWPLDTATLDSTVSDDGLPDPPASLTYLWEKVSGPGTVTFDPNEFVEDPNATFSTNGTYVLRLTASDSLLSDSDEVSIAVESDVIYVDADAVGNNNGTNWADAYNYLADALAYASSNPDINEIWVAEGIYKPDANTADHNGSGDRTATFQLINGVAIKGGYAGFGAPDPDARDIELYETSLTGDINTPDVNTDNSYHVVTGSGTDANTVLDGFTITAGNANGSFPDDSGGGMYNETGSPTVIDCTFSGNSASDGGGMANWSSCPTVTNCTFSGNSATSDGGGMRNEGISSPSSPTVINCTFSGNSADDGGGMYNRQNSNSTVINCTFSGNYSASKGGGMYNWKSSPTVTNCILWGNTASIDPEISDNGGTSSTTVSYSDVENSWPGPGNINTDPLFFDANNPDPNLRDYHLQPGSPCVDTGDNNSVPVGVTTDIDGRDRITDGDCNDTDIVDIGAYEFAWVYIGDFAGGCDVDFIDFVVLALAWYSEVGDGNWNEICDISEPNDNIIDELDFGVFAENWLAGL